MAKSKAVFSRRYALSSFRVSQVIVLMLIRVHCFLGTTLMLWHRPASIPGP